MTDDDKLADMLLTWEEARERGQHVTAEELCHDCPEMLDTLRERVRLLENAGWMRKPSTAPPSVLRTLAGRYSLEELLGEGGYAQVWRAYDLQLHRHVAVKVPKPSRTLTAELVDEVLAEARQVARLKHPHIIIVHDVVQEGAGYFIVTDLIEGQTLAARLQEGRLPTADIVRLMARVARVIDYAHAQGVVHRDLKPANIFIDKAGHPHVGDFGLARHRQDLIDGSDRRGTLAYSSPEQLEGKPLDGRSDIWSLGIILCEMLTGRQPFSDDHPVRLRQMILAEAPPELPGVPKPLVAACLRCLAKNPMDRFARGDDLADALETAVAPQKHQRWTRWAAVLVVVVLLAASVSAWANWPRRHPESTGTPSTPPEPPAVVLPLRDDSFGVFRGHDGVVRAVAVTPDGSMVASGGDDHKVHMWHVDGGESTVLEHDDPVQAVRWDRGGHAILTGTAKGTVTLWGLPLRGDPERVAAELRLLTVPLAGPWTLLAGCAPMPDSPWKLRAFPAQVGNIRAVAMSADGRFAAWAGAEKLEVWEVAGEQPMTVARTPGETIHHFAFQNDGFLLAAFGFGAEKKMTTRTWVMLKVNDRWVASPRPPGQNLELFSDVRGFTVSPDRATVLVTQSVAVRVFSLDSKVAGLHLTGSYESPKIVLDSSMILTDDRAVTVTQDRTLRVWRMKNQTELVTLHGHAKPITAIAASEKGQIVATASEDGTVRLWKIP